ncbi:MAG: hypothetical protein ACE5ES_02395 [Candidatus Nanoarchaeia archaeon]
MPKKRQKRPKRQNRKGKKKAKKKIVKKKTKKALEKKPKEHGKKKQTDESIDKEISDLKKAIEEVDESKSILTKTLEKFKKSLKEEQNLKTPSTSQTIASTTTSGGGVGAPVLDQVEVARGPEFIRLERRASTASDTTEGEHITYDQPDNAYTTGEGTRARRGRTGNARGGGRGGSETQTTYASMQDAGYTTTERKTMISPQALRERQTPTSTAKSSRIQEVIRREAPIRSENRSEAREVPYAGDTQMHPDPVDPTNPFLKKEDPLDTRKPRRIADYDIRDDYQA